MDFGDLFGGDGILPSGRLAKILVFIGFLIGAAAGGIIGYHTGFGAQEFANSDTVYAIAGALVGGFLGGLGAMLFGAYIVAFLFAGLAFFAVVGWNWITGN